MTHDSVPPTAPDSGPDPLPDPRDALASIQAARAGVAGPPEPHLGFDLLYGTSCALLVAGNGLEAPWSLLVLGIALAGLGILTASWRRRFGWWISGYSPRRARWVAFGMVAVFLVLMAVSIYGRLNGPWWLHLAAAAIGFVTAIAGSRVWMRVWRAELVGGVR